MTVKNGQELKQLQTRMAKLEVSIQSTAEEVKERQAALSKLKDQINQVRQKIKNMENKDIIVTEHAILRYLERAMGLDLEDVKRRILPESTRLMIENMGSGKYPIGDGMRVVVKGRSVVSVLD